MIKSHSTKFYFLYKKAIICIKLLIFKITYPICKFVQRKIRIFEPDESWLIIWDLICLIFYIMDVYFIPLNIAFNLPISFHSYIGLELLFEFLPLFIFVFNISLLITYLLPLDIGYYHFIKHRILFKRIIN